MHAPGDPADVVRPPSTPPASPSSETLLADPSREDREEARGLAAHPYVDVVTLTGGTAAGDALARAAGAKRFVGELGGNSPNIVLADADVEDAVKRIVPSSFEASGQQCISTQRIIVEAPVFDDFLSRFIEAAKRLKVIIAHRP